MPDENMHSKCHVIKILCATFRRMSLTQILIVSNFALSETVRFLSLFG